MKCDCDPTDKKSCLCCGRAYNRRGAKCSNAERAAAGIMALRQLGYSKEELLGTYRKHLDWQAPGLSDYVRKSLQ